MDPPPPYFGLSPKKFQFFTPFPINIIAMVLGSNYLRQDLWAQQSNISDSSKMVRGKIRGIKVMAPNT